MYWINFNCSHTDLKGKVLPGTLREDGHLIVYTLGGYALVHKDHFITL